VWEVVLNLVVLRREVVGFGLAFLAHQRRELLRLVHVVRNRSHVIEELAQQIPSAFTLHDVGSEQGIASDFHRLLEEELFALIRVDVAQPLIGKRCRAVGGLGGRGEPALVDASAVSAKGVQVIGVELQAATRNHEGSRNPARRQPQDTTGCIDDFFYAGTIHHLRRFLLF